MSKIDDRLDIEIRQVVEDLIGQMEGDARLRPMAQLSASSQTSTRVQTNGMQTLNENELKSVYALLAYVAHNENIPQETVQAVVEANFGVNHVTRIEQKDYNDVIRFLVDLRIDEMSN